MRIVELICRHVLIPLKREVSHASFSRNSTDSLVVSCRLDDGTVGWGEGLPREYVTGESIETAFRQFQVHDWTAVGEQDFQTPAELVRCSEALVFPPLDAQQPDDFGNALKCAVELAMLDAGCRSLRLPLADLIESVPEAAAMRVRRRKVQYSAAITSQHPRKVRLHSWYFRLTGFRQCKVKVGVTGVDDVTLLRQVRKHIGSKMRLRIDANEAWTPESLCEKVAELKPFGIESVEQPLPQADVASLAELRPQLGIPVILDESLCSLGDAKRAIEGGWCDQFNIRLSKCGGYVNSLKLAAMARAAGLGFQLGAQVGETGILSAAGRHFACSVDGWTSIEGSFDWFLIREPLTKQNMTFWLGGWAKSIDRPGLGVDISSEAIRRVTRREERAVL